ncbi:MAG: CpaD family pilus assembly protein [Gemmatimonadaceae bacterium]|nr:CpaD family pilus assembly protein [Caulobacter sp.]
MTRPHLHRLTPPTLGKLAATGLVLALLSACAAPGDKPDLAQAPRTDTEQWASRVQVDSRPDEVLLVPHADGLSPNQALAVDGLLARWREAEGREIVVSAPVGGPDSGVAGNMAFAARQRLVAMGAPATAVRIVGYDAGATPGAPLKVGFLRYHASVPQCGGWENITATKDNKPYENFGCAVTANMAAQLANPEDLLRPRDSTPASAQRRDDVFGKYRKGEVTSSAKDDQATGVVSKAVN